MLNKAKNAMNEISKVVTGKDALVKRITTCILAGGHIILQDMPGVGKTTMSLTFARVMGLNYQRILFTPDIMPSNLVQYSIHTQRFETDRTVRTQNNMLLADRINASSPEIQSMMVKMMEDKKLKVDGEVALLPEPYVVIATQNPYDDRLDVLPDSTIDHFMIGMSVGYPDKASEILMLKSVDVRERIENLNVALYPEDIVAMRSQVEHVYASEQILEYIVDIVNESRKSQLLDIGISPRGTKDILKMAKANAFIEGRDYVVPNDVKEVFVDTTNHRVHLSRYAKLENRKSDEILLSIVDRVPEPKGLERKR
ncbi:MAG: MoxR family ATPase [Lachnospiraceae bacterium]|nr:MoxR family ATPase [Lachnospiraceae bacterium]